MVNLPGERVPPVPLNASDDTPTSKTVVVDRCLLNPTPSQASYPPELNALYSTPNFARNVWLKCLG